MYVYAPSVGASIANYFQDWLFCPKTLAAGKNIHNLKGSLTRDFRLQVFFMHQCPPGPQVFHWSHIEFFRKFTEIFANYCLSPVSTIPVINCSAVSTTPAKNLLLVSLTLVINLCHGFSVIAGLVDTGEQFITGDNDTGNNFVAGDNNTGE